MLYTASHSIRHVAERQSLETGRTHVPDPHSASSTYEGLIDSIDGIVWEADPETLRFTFVSKQAERILGYPVRQWLEEPGFWVNHIHPDDRAEAEAFCRRAIAEGKPHEIEYRMLAADGRTVWLHDRVCVAIEAGRPVKVRGIMVDVTRRRQAEEQLRLQESRFRALIEKSSEAIALLAADGTITYVSPADRAISGSPSGEVVGTRVFDRLHPEDVSAARAALAQVVAAPRASVTAQARVRHRDGSWRWVEAVLTNLLAEPCVQAVVANYRDLTERHRLEEQLRQAQKMEAVGRLAGGVALDFNNLLTVINGYSDLALTSVRPGDPLREQLEQIRHAGERAAALTRQLLAFSRKQVLQPVVLDLNGVLRGLEQMLRRLIGEDIDLTLELEPDLWRVKVDPGQFEQVVMNLVVNARDAMPRGGTLTLETRNVTVSTAPVDHPGLRPGQYVLVAVRDTGCGMDSETMAHIFEPFFSTKGERGTGLGLAMVYGVVNQSGGHVAVDSLPGAGTTFRIYLPRVEEVPTPAPPAPEETSRHRAKETLLLVEDEEAVRRLARLTLESHGFTVLEAHSPGDALLLAEQHSGPIDLLVTDVIMPGMSGRDLAERLLRSRPGLKVFYVSGYSDDVLDERGCLGPGMAFLAKPYSPATLARKMFEILRR